MKKALEFNVQFNYLEPQNFIQCFASAYMFLEASRDPSALFYDPDVGGHCVGCGSGGALHHCRKDRAAAKRCALFFLLNTMCGNSAVRRSFNGEPTDMQMLLGDTHELGHGCGTDFVVDFLFGYAGYEYRACGDADAFKDEVTASIDDGKPVIAKINAGSARQLERYYVITGYDGGALTVPHVDYYDFASNPPTRKPEITPTYDELDVLYVFGAKANRRYTLRDGLANIRRVMEYNIHARLWDEYLEKLGGWEAFPSGDGLDKASPEERKARAKHWAETNIYMYNICSFCGAFCSEKLPNHYLYKELLNPALAALWDGIGDPHEVILNAGHKTGALIRAQIWLIDDPSRVAALSAEVCGEIIKAKEADIMLLDIINKAIAVLDKERGV